MDHGVSLGSGVVLVWRLQSVPNGADSIGAVDAWEFLMVRNTGVLVAHLGAVVVAAVVLVLVLDAGRI